MNALNGLVSAMVSDFTEFSENVTNSRSEDYWRTGIRFISILMNLFTTLNVFVLIPSKYVRDVLLWERGIYRYSTPKILVMLMMVLIFYINCANDLILSLICFMPFNIIVRWNAINHYGQDDVFDALWENNDSDEREEDDTDFKRNSELRVIFHILSLFWIILQCGVKPWLGYSQWNLWNGIFDDEIEWKLLSGLLLLTYHAFDLVQKGVFGRVVCRSSKFLMHPAAIFLVLLFDVQIWILDAEKREQRARIYLLIYLSLFTTSIYNILKIAYIRPHEQFNIRENEQKKVRRSCARLILASVYLLNSGIKTRFLSPHLLVLVFIVIHLLLTMFIDYYTYINNMFFVNFQTQILLKYVNTIMLKVLFLVIVVGMCVYQGVTYFRVATIVVLSGLMLKDSRTFSENKFLPQICIESLHEASAQQLAVNDDVCLMCHEEMHSAKVTPCNHFYHTDCLLTWLCIKNKCPLCQRVLYIINN